MVCPLLTVTEVPVPGVAHESGHREVVRHPPILGQAHRVKAQQLGIGRQVEEGHCVVAQRG